MSFGFQEILILILLLALVFGAKKLPELGRGIGEGIRNFRKTMKDDDESNSDTTKNNSDKNQN